MSCTILGDSIAIGVAYGMPECRSAAHTGISTRAFARIMVRPVTADTVVISLGANDGPTLSAEALRGVRRGVAAATVLWLLPNVTGAVRAIIQRVAAERGDALLDVVPYSAPSLHPTMRGYRQIGAAIRQRGSVKAAS